mgnify:CR=1 FL=1
MGILDGKRILVAGVTMDSSIGFATAKVAQEQGATVLISNFGRALGITRRIAKRLPADRPELKERLQRALGMLSGTVKSTQDTIDRLRPSQLDNLGLAVALGRIPRAPAVGAGAHSEIGPVAPVSEIVAALLAGAGVVRARAVPVAAAAPGRRCTAT